MDRQRHVLSRTAAAAVLSLLAVTSCGGTESGRARSIDKRWEAYVEPTVTPGAVLDLDFDQAAGPGDVVPRLKNEGSARVQIALALTGGGRFVWARGRDGGGAVRTPAYAPSGTIPGAAIVVQPVAGEPDRLSPGRADFSFGLDFRPDAAPPGRPGDDGDNLLQRGRYGAAPQYKLQLDQGVPSCRVQGSAGEALVKADRAVQAGRWYRLECGRRGGRVTLTLLDLGTLQRKQWVHNGDVGAMDFSGGSAAPLSVAAKVGSNGQLDTGSLDQYHGEVDRVFLDVR
ncbi:hypothetical protein JK386_01425 [Nocardioides sp. zg-536]|uniref:LamG domain-containing protein n=1 Tax=Nocardioides faecalis TaxID=2803858 RepID=A0A938Y3H7_9ACTN|nr:hypothetical protein [Nocardioides faecalis]MBM9458555.1 hypothetical protein [Nocardioides faecalis]QVI58557.1 hypothetical protein KG111_16515 [Nocardioides faecalis]